MLWDGMGWDGMGWDGMGWDGMEEMDRMGWDGMGWDEMGWGNILVDIVSYLSRSQVFHEKRWSPE